MKKKTLVVPVNDIKVRKSWGAFNPSDRIVESKKVYKRNREKRVKHEDEV